MNGVDLCIIDILIVAAIIVCALYSGLLDCRVASTGLQAYFLAGRTVKRRRAGVSMAATQSSADKPLLGTAAAAQSSTLSITHNEGCRKRYSQVVSPPCVGSVLVERRFRNGAGGATQVRW